MDFVLQPNLLFKYCSYGLKMSNHFKVSYCIGPEEPLGGARILAKERYKGWWAPGPDPCTSYGESTAFIPEMSLQTGFDRRRNTEETVFDQRRDLVTAVHDCTQSVR